MQKVPFGLRSILNPQLYLRIHGKGGFWIKIDFESLLFQYEIHTKGAFWIKIDFESSLSSTKSTEKVPFGLRSISNLHYPL